MVRATVLLVLLAMVGLVPTAVGAASEVRRVAGDDRILTAVELSQEAFPTAGSAPAAVVARDREFADALAAAPLAVAAGGPVLLNPRDELSQPVRDEIERLGASTVYLMGGEEAQSAQVEQALQQMSGVDRVVRVEDTREGRRDRFGTAAQAARLATDLWGGTGAHVLVALGAHSDPGRAWPDALSAGQLAGHARRPIVLVTPDEVPAATREVLDEFGTDTATVIGGPAAIAPSTADDLGVATVRRLGGATRYDTSALVADAALQLGGSLDPVLAATGSDFADGLAAGPASVHLGGVQLLVAPGHLADSAHAHDWFADHRQGIGAILVAGGPAAVSDPVLGHLEAATSDLAALQLRWTPIATGLAGPLDVEVRAGDQRLYVAEQGGRVLQVFPDGGTRVFLDIRGRVQTGGERGLLGIAFHPQDPSRLFAYYTRVNADDATWLVEYRAGDAAVDPASEIRLDDFAQPYSNHNGGGLEFAPDGTLHLALGDGGGGGDPDENGQDTGTQLGSILRYQVGVRGSVVAPSDNPFAGGGGDDLILHVGLRNPFRFSFDPVDDRLFVGDVGQGTREEIDAVPSAARGLNLGWDVWEGTFCHEGPCSQDGFTFPVHEYATGSDGTCAVTGGVVYRGRALPELAGTYLYADFCHGSLRSLRVDDAGQATEQRTWSGLDAGNPAGFGIDHDGEVYVADLAGRLLKLTR